MMLLSARAAATCRHALQNTARSLPAVEHVAGRSSVHMLAAARRTTPATSWLSWSGPHSAAAWTASSALLLVSVMPCLPGLSRAQRSEL